MAEVVVNSSLNKICRTCLSENQSFLEFLNFNEVCINTETKFSDMLSAISFIKIDANDGLPEEICQQCAEKTILAFNFKTLCQQSESTLQKSFQQSIKYEECDAEHPANILMLPIDKFEDINSSTIQSELINNKINENIAIKNDKVKIIVRKLKKPSIELNVIENNESIPDEINIEIDKQITETLHVRKYICRLCKKIFENILDLQNHRKSHVIKPSNVRYNCHLCERSYSRIHTLQLHLVTHSETRAHLCPICGKRFHLAGGLQQHLKYHAGIKKHSCEICNKKFYYIQRLNEHVRIAHSENRYSHVCKICNKKYTCKSSLTTHMKAHSGDRPHECETCGRRFTILSYLKNHIRTHTREPPPRVFLCTYENCEGVFPSNASLNLHIRHKHTKERPFSCEICNKSFYSRGGVTEHSKSHFGPKTDPCGICGKQFVYKTSLRKHMRLHTGEKPYPCDHCSEKFTTSSRRNEHIKIKHMERQEECPLCHKRFHLRRTLKHHLRTHANKKRLQTYALPQSDNSIAPINIDSKQKVPEPGFEVVV